MTLLNLLIPHAVLGCAPRRVGTWKLTRSDDGGGGRGRGLAGRSKHGSVSLQDQAHVHVRSTNSINNESLPTASLSREAIEWQSMDTSRLRHAPVWPACLVRVACPPCPPCPALPCYALHPLPTTASHITVTTQFAAIPTWGTLQRVNPRQPCRLSATPALSHCFPRRSRSLSITA